MLTVSEIFSFGYICHKTQTITGKKKKNDYFSLPASPKIFIYNERTTNFVCNNSFYNETHNPYLQNYRTAPPFNPNNSPLLCLALSPASPRKKKKKELARNIVSQGRSFCRRCVRVAYELNNRRPF